jgi:hypothetical protein
MTGSSQLAVRTVRSGFGAQYDSRKSTAPNYGFGSSVRDAAKKQHISAEHAKVTPVTYTPGAIYDTPSSIGKQTLSQTVSGSEYSFGSQARLPKSKDSNLLAPGPGAYKTKGSVGPQVDSTRASASNFSFGTTTRDGQEKVFLSADHTKADYGKGSPGPAVYSIKSSLAGQVLSQKATAPSWKMGTDHRFVYDYVIRASKLPGVGQYRHYGSVGPQVESRKSTRAMYTFGTCKREQREHMYLSADHEKAHYGLQSPGPVTASQQSSMSAQVSSRKQSMASWRFGTAKRFTVDKRAMETPGPDAYD